MSFLKSFWIALIAVTVVACIVGWLLWGWAAVAVALLVAVAIPVALFVMFFAAWMASGSH